MDTLKAFLTWFAPIASAVIVAALTAQINARTAAQQAKEESKRKDEKAWQEDISERITDVDDKLDVLRDATQTTMRTSLLHYIEKYLTRGWVTPEERASIMDMHTKYTALDANGFIDRYMERVAELPDKEI